VAVVFGSVVALYISVTLPGVFLVALTACALALLTPPGPGVDELSEGDPSGGLYRPREFYLEGVGHWHLIGRSLVGGLMLGVVAAHQVVYLLLLLAAPVLSARRHWRLVVPAAVVGTLLALALTWQISGLWSEVTIVPGAGEPVEVTVGPGVTEIEKADLLVQERGSLTHSPRLLGWNALYAAVGSRIGVVPHFAPALFLLVVWRRSDGGWLLLVLTVLGLLVSTLIAPFDFAGLPAAIGNSVFLPFYVLLWFLPMRPLGPRAGLLAVAVGVAILWPLWVSSEGPLARLQAGTSRGPVLDRLPHETTQRDLPVGGEVVTRDLLVRSMSGLRAGGRGGHFRLPKGGQADLLIAAPGELRALEFQFDAAASTDVNDSGGEVGDMILDPSGGVVFKVLPTPSRVRHPVWWSQDLHSFYRIRVAMPNASGETTFSISSAG
jgi:hypothetical protein